MAVNTFGGATLILFLLFVAPGLLALKTRLWVSRQPTEHDRIDTTVFSVIFSIGSLVLLYLVWSYIQWEFIGTDTILGVSLAQLLGIYISHIIQCLLLGIAAGSFAHNYIEDNRIRDLYNSWEFAFQFVHSAIDVDVKTSDGSWIRGHVIQYGTTNGVRDLILSSPRLVYSPDANDESEIPLGENVYLDEPDILRVVFHEHSDEDPDSTVLDADRFQMRLKDLYKASNISPYVNNIEGVYQDIMSTKRRYPKRIAVCEFSLISMLLIVMTIFLEVDLSVWYIVSGFTLGMLLYDSYYQDRTTAILILIFLSVIGWIGLGHHFEFSLVDLGSTGLALFAGAIMMMFSKYATLRYSPQPIWILGVSTSSVLLTIIWFSVYGYFPISPIREFILITALSIVVLFCERMHNGVANRYDNWPLFFIHCSYYSAATIVSSLLLIWPYGASSFLAHLTSWGLLVGVAIWMLRKYTAHIWSFEESVADELDFPESVY